MKFVNEENVEPKVNVTLGTVGDYLYLYYNGLSVATFQDGGLVTLPLTDHQISELHKVGIKMYLSAKDNHYHVGVCNDR